MAEQGSGPIRPAGLVAAPVTPFTPDNRVDQETYAVLVDYLIRQGSDVIVVAMHLGESLNLTVDERKLLAETAVESAAGRVPVYVHASMPGTDAAVDLAVHGDRAGAAGAVVITPYHWHPSHELLVDHFVAVADAIDGHLIAYNYPERLGVTVTPMVVTDIINRCENFVGVKTADLHMEYITEVCRVGKELRPDFSVFTGVEYALGGMILGAAGTFSVCGGIAPVLVRDLMDACLTGEYERGQELQYRYSALWTLLKDAYPARFKAAMEIMGRPCGPARRPAPTLDTGQMKSLEADMDAMGILGDEPHGW